MNGYLAGYNGYQTFMPINSQAKTDNYPAYVFTYVSAPPASATYGFAGSGGIQGTGIAGVAYG